MRQHFILTEEELAFIINNAIRAASERETALEIDFKDEVGNVVQVDFINKKRITTESK
jgi:hypothetical protein